MTWHSSASTASASSRPVSSRSVYPSLGSRTLTNRSSPVSTFVELLEYLDYDTADPKPAAVTFDLRAHEKVGELRDGLTRFARGFNRARKAVVPVTTVAARFSGNLGEKSGDL